jgi:hypothetical protein
MSKSGDGSSRTKWAGNVARIRRRVYIEYWREIKKGLLGRPTGRWENNNKMDLREIERGVMNWIHQAHGRDQ